VSFQTVLQESKTIEVFSGIPVAALKSNDEKTTELNLKNSGCGQVEGALLGALLKVVCLQFCVTLVVVGVLAERKVSLPGVKN
jgi:hypothetical protein